MRFSDPAKKPHRASRTKRAKQAQQKHGNPLYLSAIANIFAAISTGV
jgi:hypothetical protein